MTCHVIRRLASSLCLGVLCTIGTAWVTAVSDIDAKPIWFMGGVKGFGPDPPVDADIPPMFGTVTINVRRCSTVVNASAPFRIYRCGNANAVFDEKSGRMVEVDPRSEWGRPWNEVTPYWAHAIVKAYMLAPNAPEMVMRDVHICAYGWPMRAMQSIRTLDSSVRPSRVVLKGAIPVDHPANARLIAAGGQGIFLPTLPIWRGILGNTAVFAGSAWLLLAAIPRTRRFLRRRRNHCPTCNYSLVGLAASAPCPECGTASDSIMTEH